MQTLGQYLKEQREMRDIPLTAVSDETKIAVNWLEAIESDNLGVLPGKAFAKGFIKSYARMLELEEDEVVSMYDDAVKDNIEEVSDTPSFNAFEIKSKIWRYLAALFVAALIVALIIWIS